VLDADTILVIETRHSCSKRYLTGVRGSQVDVLSDLSARRSNTSIVLTFRRSGGDEVLSDS